MVLKMKRKLTIVGIIVAALLGTNAAAKVYTSGGSTKGALWLMLPSFVNLITPFWAKPKASLGE